MKEITIISKGKKHICLVDDEDYDLVKGYSWCIFGRYVGAYVKGSKPRKNIFMHRLILGILNNPEIITDHINHNHLDNRRFNIRRCTNTENCKNTTAWGSSKYLGVSILNSANRRNNIRAQININGKDKVLGHFKSETEAAKVYDKAAKIHHGEFANLNFK